MKEEIEIVKHYYEENSESEWQRLEAHPFEFVFTTYMMDRYIKPGDTILDIGGGPGRYAIHYAKKGCDVTLLDLAKQNISIALTKAKEAGVALKTYVANCLDLDSLGLEKFDHVFLMGPLYHLLEETDRIKAVELALKHLKSGGNIYVSFILGFAGIIYDLKNPGLIEQDYQNPLARQLIEAIKTQKNYEGDAFTKACFYHQKNILPFMERFPLRKLHLFGQEGIFSPNEESVLQRDETEIALWIEIGKGFLELEELLSYSEHAMYIGKKTEY